MNYVQDLEKELKGKTCYINQENIDKVLIHDYLSNTRKVLNSQQRWLKLMEEGSFDKQKIIECMFDPVTSEILAELENGGKDSSYLAEKSGISEEEVRKQLSYLSQYKFVTEQTNNGKVVYSVDAQKLSKVLENEENFDSVTDGLTKMDSYLN